MDGRPTGESVEEGEARRSCVKAFFLLSWRVGARAADGMKTSGAAVVLPAGKLRRLS